MTRERVVSEEDEQAGIQSVEVAGAILQALLRSDHPQRLSDVARHANLPAAKVHRYLVSLARIGLATQDLATGRYDLGPMAMQIGLKGFSRFDALRYAAEALDGLVQKLGETGALVIWGEHGPKFVRMIEARHSQASTVPVTHVCPLTWSATGLLFSAYEEPSRTRTLILRELEQNALLNRPVAPRNEAELRVELERVRTQRFAAVADGGGGGIGGISAPIFDISGKLAMGLSVFAQAGRIDIRPDSPLVAEICAVADKLSQAFGFDGQLQVPELSPVPSRQDLVEPQPRRRGRQQRGARL